MDLSREHLNCVIGCLDIFCFDDRFRYESERVQQLLISEILVCSNAVACGDAIALLIEATEELLRCQSYHCVMLLAFALQSHSIFSLKSAWKKVESTMPGRWEAIEAKIGSGGNLITRSIIQRYGELNMMDDLSTKVRAANPFILKLDLDEKDDIDASSMEKDDSISNMMHRFVPKNSDCFRWEQYITQLLRRTYLSGVVKSDWSTNSPISNRFANAANINENVNTNNRSNDEERENDGKNKAKRTEIQPCLPFFNGLIRSLVRSNELPDYIKQMDYNNNRTGQFELQSPGITPSDPFFPVLNVGKLRAIASIVSILRFCQCTPYTFATSTDIQTYFQKRAIFATEDAQWAKSQEIERGDSRSRYSY